MIEAVAKIAEAAQEVAVSVEECKISISVIEDMRNLMEQRKPKNISICSSNSNT